MKNNSIIYFKAPTKVTLYNRKSIVVGDLGQIHGEEKLVGKIKGLRIWTIKDPAQKEQLTISLMDVIKRINKEFPEVDLINLGEMNVVIYYWPEKKQENKYFTFIKVITICLTLVCGSAFAIMTFHTDASVPNVFATMNEIFTGEYIERPFWIIIPYSIGLLTGVTVFFNHFGKKMITEDPTPIQVELQKYDTDVTSCLIDVLSSETNDRGEKN